MTSTLTIFLSVIGALIVWWSLLTRGVPGLLRASFERTVAEIQRELDEAVVDGVLPADDFSVVSLNRNLEAVVDHADRLSPAFSTMLNRAMNAHGRPLQVRAQPQQTFANLSAAQRRLMHGLDKRLADALTRYVTYGSLSGWWQATVRRLRTVLRLGPARVPGVTGYAASPFATVNLERRSRPGEGLVSTRLAMGALIEADVEPGLEKPLAQC